MSFINPHLCAQSREFSALGHPPPQDAHPRCEVSSFWKLDPRSASQGLKGATWCPPPQEVEKKQWAVAEGTAAFKRTTWTQILVLSHPLHIHQVPPILIRRAWFIMPLLPSHRIAPRSRCVCRLLSAKNPARRRCLLSVFE